MFFVSHGSHRLLDRYRYCVYLLDKKIRLQKQRESTHFSNGITNREAAQSGSSILILSPKPDTAFWFWIGGHELVDGFEYHLELRVVFLFQSLELTS